MNSNEALIRNLFDLFGQRQLEEAVRLFSEDVVFHVPGSSAISGSYRGRSEVLRYWRRQIDRSQGSLRTHLLAIDSTGGHVVVDVRITADQGGSEVSWRRRVDYTIEDDCIIGASVVESDQAKADAFFGPPQ